MDGRESFTAQPGQNKVLVISSEVVRETEFETTRTLTHLAARKKLMSHL